MLSRILLLLLVLSTSSLFAVDGKIKVFIKSNKGIYTSQKVTVSVELLSDAFSITDAKIAFPISNEYIFKAPKSAAYLGQAEVNAESWQMVHYDYDVYLLKAGKIKIPAMQVKFMASMGYGQPKKEFILRSQNLYVDVKTPEGVGSDKFVLVTDNFALESKMNPKRKELVIGDALELSITQKAKGIPDILLKHMAYKSNEFLRVYSKEPLLKSGLKGYYDVSRTDKFTFVASGEGNVTIPSKEVLWWSSKTKKLHTEKTPAYTIEIIPDPQIAIDAQKEQEKQNLLYILVILLVILILYLLFASKIRAYFTEKKRLYMESEEGKFSILKKALDKNDAHLIYKELYVWLLSIDPELIRGGFATIIAIEPSLKTSLDSLEENLLHQEQKVDTISLQKGLNALRETLLKKEKSLSEGLPQTINPD